MVFRSGGRGDWWMIGRSKLKMTHLHFAYDGAGVLLWLEKISEGDPSSRSRLPKFLSSAPRIPG
jgi:hypothetical protein